MNPLDHVSVVGAGPSGLAAAIALARRGIRVTVYERHRQVGGRFHGDFQGLENWTTEVDVLEWLAGLGIEPTFPHRPMDAITLVGPDLRAAPARSDRPLLYVVQRGPQPGSLDRALRARAEELGITIRFGQAVQPKSLPGPVIVATGPHGTQAVVAGVLAETSHPDQVVVIAKNALAPKCYAYCVIWNGRATVATALATDFPRAWSCFQLARDAFARVGLTDFRNERRFGGRANITLGRPLQEGPRLYVGEAAGLQDYFLGFGLRYAVGSANLAAEALVGGVAYPKLVARKLGGRFHAGFVNRMLYNHIGDPGYRCLFRWLGRAPNPGARARMVYSFTPLHRLLWPVAQGLAWLHGGSLGGRLHD
ncbi:MAG: FAD-dependent oxidoreductase [Gemmatimonadota bacterium]